MDSRKRFGFLVFVCSTLDEEKRHMNLALTSMPNFKSTNTVAFGDLAALITLKFDMAPTLKDMRDGYGCEI